MPVMEVTATASSNAVEVAPTAVAWSSVPAGASTDVPPVLNRSQAYYWTHIWQQREREAVKELREGKSRVFADPADAIRWLLSDDEG